MKWFMIALYGLLIVSIVFDVIRKGYRDINANHICESIGGSVKSNSGGIIVCGMSDGDLKAFGEKK